MLRAGSPRLTSLFGVFFGEDTKVFGDTIDDVIATYSDLNPDELGATLADLDALRGTTEPAEWGGVLDDLGCDLDFEVRGTDPMAFVHQVRESLSKAANRVATGREGLVRREDFPELSSLFYVSGGGLGDIRPDD